MSDPSDVLSERPKGPSREQTEKIVYDKFPGHIAWATDRANFSGCRLVCFSPGQVLGLTGEDEERFVKEVADEAAALSLGRQESWAAVELMNKYFSTRANLLVVQMIPSGEDLYALVTTQLDEEDLEDFQEATRVTQIAMRESRARRAKDREAKAEALREEQRLARVGRLAEEHNLSGRNRELVAENAELRKKLEELDAAGTKK